jgi:hypothetical protein
MDFGIRFESNCPVCGKPLTPHGSGVCVLCFSLSCTDHLVAKNGVVTCEACVPAREQRESASGVSADDEARVVSLLRLDVEATIGPGHSGTIIEAAAQRRLYIDDPAWYVGCVVDDVQQRFHDTFVDTTWPSCPHHPHHPLWFADGWWRCEAIAEPVAPLGGLSKVNARG